MGDQVISGVLAVATTIVGLAVLATLVSKNANTGHVIGAAGRALSGAISAAEGPVLGGSSYQSGLTGGTYQQTGID